VLNAQRRRRLILVAGRGFEVPFALPAKNRRTVRDAIGNMPAAGKSGDPLHDLPEKTRTPRIARLIRDIPKDGGSRHDLPRNRQLNCHRKSDGFYDVYGRMAWDDVAPTITSGCFNPSKGRFLHPTANRAITMREAALLQSFPRNYKFDVSPGKEAIALMIGNALPPELIRRQARQIAAVLKTR
jgi:DNA (cytosine-5)-methyltransferase 1